MSGNALDELEAAIEAGLTVEEILRYLRLSDAALELGYFHAPRI